MTARSASLLLPPGLRFSVRGDKSDMIESIRDQSDRGKRKAGKGGSRGWKDL